MATERDKKALIKATPEELEAMLGRIIPELVNAQHHKDYLEEMVYRMISPEIAVLYTYPVPEIGVSFHINKQMLDIYDVSEEELFTAAVKNDAGRHIVLDMADILPFSNERGFIVVITKDNRYEGAAGILQQDILKSVSGMLGGNYWVIPSSIHEALCLKETSVVNSKDLKRLTSLINGSPEIIHEEDVLGETPLFYDAEAGTLRVSGEVGL